MTLTLPEEFPIFFCLLLYSMKKIPASSHNFATVIFHLEKIIFFFSSAEARASYYKLNENYSKITEFLRKFRLNWWVYEVVQRNRRKFLINRIVLKQWFGQVWLKLFQIFSETIFFLFVLTQVFWCFQGDQKGTLGRKGLSQSLQ